MSQLTSHVIAGNGASKVGDYQPHAFRSSAPHEVAEEQRVKCKKSMEKCSNCKNKFPSEILSPLVTSDGISGSVCGICALKLSNEALGVDRKEFTGEIAESMRLAAIKFLKQ